MEKRSSPDDFCEINLQAELNFALDRAMATADLLAALTLDSDELKPGTINNAGVGIFRDLEMIRKCCERIAKGVKNGRAPG